ncbi:hypothetical protein BDZ91DRAFT_715712 [Kalaharituber pfeilii]|nr:hypothetical protein BDZ91DRAFT_715712 [Kalaharituber pfeilii]
MGLGLSTDTRPFRPWGPLLGAEHFEIISRKKSPATRGPHLGGPRATHGSTPKPHFFDGPCPLIYPLTPLAALRPLHPSRPVGSNRRTYSSIG